MIINNSLGFKLLAGTVSELWLTKLLILIINNRINWHHGICTVNKYVVNMHTMFSNKMVEIKVTLKKLNITHKQFFYDVIFT